MMSQQLDIGTFCSYVVGVPPEALIGQLRGVQLWQLCHETCVPFRHQLYDIRLVQVLPSMRQDPCLRLPTRGKPCY